MNSFLFSYNIQLPANDESPEAKGAGTHGTQTSAAALANCFHSDTDFLRATRYSLSRQDLELFDKRLLLSAKLLQDED